MIRGPHGHSEVAAAPRRREILINLALQGGGAHGAFTRGVLDRLLEEARLRSDGISGTSARAMNAAVLASAHAKGGAEGRRTAVAFLAARDEDLGRYSSLDLDALLRSV